MMVSVAMMIMGLAMLQTTVNGVYLCVDCVNHNQNFDDNYDDFDDDKDDNVGIKTCQLWPQTERGRCWPPLHAPEFLS